MNMDRSGGLCDIMCNRSKSLSLLFATLVVAYGIVVWRTFLTSGPETAPPATSDIFAYVRMASLPVFSQEFVAGERAFIYALFLKLCGNDLVRAGYTQTLISVVCWSLLALSLNRLLCSVVGKVLGVIFVLNCALREEILLWNSVSLSESLSCSLMALWITSWVMFMRGSHWFWKVFPIASSFMFAFVRDSNAFLVLGASIMVAIACAFRFIATRHLLVSLSLLLLFVGAQTSRSISIRSKYSLQNILGARILTEQGRIDELRKYGMVLSMADRDISLLKGKCGNEFASAGMVLLTLQRPGAVEFFRWVDEKHYSSYVKFLLLNPGYTLTQPFREDGVLKFLFPMASWVPQKTCSNVPIRDCRPPRFHSNMPAVLDRVSRGESPGVVLAFWLALAVLSMVAFVIHRPYGNRWLLPILLLATSYPHLLIIWHGDAMDVPRHALLVGIQVHLSVSILSGNLIDIVTMSMAGRSQRFPSSGVNPAGKVLE